MAETGKKLLFIYHVVLVRCIPMPRKKVIIDPQKGKRLKEIVALSGLSQKKVAEIAHLAPQHLSNIICGKRNLTLDIAQLIKATTIPSMRIQYVMCMDDFKTEEEKDAYSRAVWEQNHGVSVFFDKVSRCFIDGIADKDGYLFGAQKTDPLIGEYVEVTDQNGKIVGAVPADAFERMRDELEHYASYLVHLTVKNEMIAAPGSGDRKEED